MGTNGTHQMAASSKIARWPFLYTGPCDSLPLASKVFTAHNRRGAALLAVGKCPQWARAPESSRCAHSTILGKRVFLCSATPRPVQGWGASLQMEHVDGFHSVHRNVF
jgi:hypothetical protein